MIPHLNRKGLCTRFSPSQIAPPLQYKYTQPTVKTTGEKLPTTTTSATTQRVGHTRIALCRRRDPTNLKFSTLSWTIKKKKPPCFFCFFRVPPKWDDCWVLTAARYYTTAVLLLGPAGRLFLFLFYFPSAGSKKGLWSYLGIRRGRRILRYVLIIVATFEWYKHKSSMTLFFSPKRGSIWWALNYCRRC